MTENCWPVRWLSLAVFTLAVVALSAEGVQLRVAGLLPQTGALAVAGVQRSQAAQMAVDVVNDGNLFHNGEELLLDLIDTATSPTEGYGAASEVSADTLVLFGECWSEVSASIALLQRPQLAVSSTATVLSGPAGPFPSFSRMVPSDGDGQVAALAALVQHYGWQQSVAAVATADTYGAGLLAELQRSMAGSLRASALLEGEGTEQLAILRSSGAHVFFALMLAGDFQALLPALSEGSLLGEDYVWLCSDGCAQMSSFATASANATASLQAAADGLLGTIPCGTGSGTLYNGFLDLWHTLYGSEEPNVYALHTYDGIFALGHAFAHLLVTEPNPELWRAAEIVQAIRSVAFDGVSGHVQFNSVGDRLCDVSIVNFSALSGTFSTIGHYSATDGLVLSSEPLFYGNTTAVPSFEDAFDFEATYWSCLEKAELPYTISVQLQDPAVAGQVDNIPMRYACDQYADCSNFSDEPISCGSTSITLWWLICGVVASVGLVASVLVTAGCSVPYVKWRLNKMEEEIRPSPTSTVVVCFAVVLASVAVYASFGKPSDVTCGIRTLAFVGAVEVTLAVVVAELVYIWVAARREDAYNLMHEGKRVEVAGKVPRAAAYAIALLVPTILFIVWVIFGSPFADARVGIDGKYHYLCAFNTASEVVFACIVFDCLLKLVVGLAFSIMLRRRLKFSLYLGSKQCRSAALALQNFLFWAAATALIWMVGGASATTEWVAKAVLVLYITYSTLLITVLPHVFAAIGRNPLASALGVEEQTVELTTIQSDGPPMEDSFSLDYDRFLDDSNDEEAMETYSKLD